MSAPLAAINKDQDLEMLMLWAHRHTYSIFVKTQITVSDLTVGTEAAIPTDSPPVYVRPTDLDAEPKNRASINDVIRSEEIIGQSLSSLPLPRSRRSFRSSEWL